MKRDFKGIWIPKEIWLTEELTIMEIFLLAEIHSIDGDIGCHATNNYFAKMLGITDRSIRTYIARLIKKGYIKRTGRKGRNRVLKSNLRTLLKKRGK